MTVGIWMKKDGEEKRMRCPECKSEILRCPKCGELLDYKHGRQLDRGYGEYYECPNCKWLWRGINPGD